MHFELEWLNLPVLLGVIKIAFDIGKYKYMMRRIEERCCLSTLKCPMDEMGGHHGQET